MHSKIKHLKKGSLQLRFKPFNLQLRNVFTLSNNSRNTTPIILTEIEYEGYIGYGEASMPPYLGENQDSAQKFLSQLDLTQFHDPHQIEEILLYVDQSEPGNNAAKASVDIALHDLIGKLNGQSCYEMWSLNPNNTPETSFTIGIDTLDIIQEKVRQANTFKQLKIKLGTPNDKEIIKAIRSITQVPLSVDANQGWTDKQEALDLIFWLKEQGVIFIEQPMPTTMIEEMAWLTAHSPLPTIADESVKRLADIKDTHQVYSGINIKLMKSTGLNEARKMIEQAKSMNMKIMLGCMTETSCAISAAAQLSPLAHWADLDGNLLISNDIFDGVKISSGKIKLNKRPGIGAIPLDHQF